MSIYVTKSFMPPIEEYKKYIDNIYSNSILTNQGPCVLDLQQKMQSFLGVSNLHYLTNGTIALQLALSAMDIYDGEIITTPFSYVATLSSILWERCIPVFVDIEPDNFTIDVTKIEDVITSKTRAIMPVHVFGYACDVEKIHQIADKYNLKIIYDGAHAFASKFKGKSLLSYGDITTCSFHATKLFHTIEGGACISRKKEISDRIKSIKNFGSVDGKYKNVGINAKMTEINAAMGLANLKYIDDIIGERKRIYEIYDTQLEHIVARPRYSEDIEYNYIYYPIILKNEIETLNVIKKLNENDINPRRYFYPSLNNLEYLENRSKCPISDDISKRILSLPLYNGLEERDVLKICDIIKGVVK